MQLPRTTPAPIFNIAEQVSPPTRRPFFIVETNFTSDGPRSRICSGRWATQDEAKTALDQTKKDMDLVK